MSELSIWRLHEVVARTGLSRSTIYDRMKNGDFPMSVSLGPRAVGWIADEVIDWLNEQIRKSRDGDPE